MLIVSDKATETLAISHIFTVYSNPSTDGDRFIAMHYAGKLMASSGSGIIEMLMILET